MRARSIRTVPDMFRSAHEARPSPAIALTPGHRASGMTIPHLGHPGMLTLRVEYSFDGGRTWPHWAQATMPADATDGTGRPLDHEVLFTWLNPESARPTHQRHIIIAPVKLSTMVQVIEEFER